MTVLLRKRLHLSFTEKVIPDCDERYSLPDCNYGVLTTPPAGTPPESGGDAFCGCRGKTVIVKTAKHGIKKQEL